MKFLPLLSIALLIIVASGCKKETTAFTDTPVIESYLVPGDTVRINISRQIPFIDNPNYSKDDLSNLNLNATCNGSLITMRSYGSGVYKSDQFLVPSSGNFELDFKFNDKNVHAYTYIPSSVQNFTSSVKSFSLTKIDSTNSHSFGGISQPDPVELTWTNVDASNYLVLVQNLETNPVPIRDFGNSTRPNFVFRKQPTNGSGEQLRPQEFQYFGLHRIILYHVLPDYATLYNQNSNSSQNLTNPSTSISNGYGIFTGLNTDTIYFQVLQN